MTQENAPVNRSERDTVRGADPGSADENTILNYVMLDFADEHFGPRKLIASKKCSPRACARYTDRSHGQPLKPTREIE